MLQMRTPRCEEAKQNGCNALGLGHVLGFGVSCRCAGACPTAAVLACACPAAVLATGFPATVHQDVR